MNRPTLDRRLQQAEDLVSRMEKNIVFQRQMIATLDGGGHDVKAAKMFLRRLEATQTRRRQGPIVQGTGEALVGLHWQRPKGAMADLDLAKKLSRDLPLRSY